MERGFKHGDGLRLVTTLLSALIYLPLVVWLSFWISLRAKSQGRAILISLGAIVVWSVLQIVLIQPPEIVHMSPLAQFLSVLISPLFVILTDQATGATPAMIAFNFLVYGGLLVFIRRSLLKRADRYLGRLGDQTS